MRPAGAVRERAARRSQLQDDRRQSGRIAFIDQRLHLVEDVLDPNRNVDPAFRYSNVILKDGRLITGLQKKEEGEVLTFADTTGKLVAVKKSEIRQRIESPASLMPSNFAEIIKEDDFNNLMAYLLSK